MRLGNYELGEPYLTVGPSTFFRASNALLGLPVIVRRLTIDPARPEDARATFFRESRHAAALLHPRIWKPQDVLEADGYLWSVHEQRITQTSDVLVRQHGPFPVAQAAHLGVQMADALAHMHSRSSVHGKVAPRWVSVDEHGDATLLNLVKSADLAAGIWPLRPVVLGLSPFSAPEELLGARSTPQGDLYSLAATLFFWLTGRYPRGGEGEDEALQRVRAGEPVDTGVMRRALPASLLSAIQGALEAQPAARRGSVAALGSMLAELERRHGADVPAGFEPGTVLPGVCDSGDVRIVERHGSGAFGIVFRARTGDGLCEVAVKALKPEHRDDRESLERFTREARALEGIEHPHVVRILGVGEQRGTPYAVMEFIDGPDLGTILLRDGALEPLRAARLARGVAEGLEAIHRGGVIHRDLKPHNVLVGPQERAVIADFGVARTAAATRLTMTGQLVGSPAYMAPEQLDDRPVTSATDLYALGAMLYELLAGRPPFTGSDTLLTLRRIREEPHVPLTEPIPERLRRLVDALLSKDPAGRPLHAGWVAEELARVTAEGRPESATV